MDDKPEDFYTYVLLLVTKYLNELAYEIGHVQDKKSRCVHKTYRGAHFDLGHKIKKIFLFIFGRHRFDRRHIKKLIMTIPYNAGQISQLKYLKESLFLVDKVELFSGYPLEEFNEDLSKMVPIKWYSKTETLEDCKSYVSNNDLRELVKIIFKIITSEFNKINKG